MEWVVGSGMVLGLLAVAAGMASIRTGWTLPWVRRRVTHPPELNDHVRKADGVLGQLFIRSDLDADPTHITLQVRSERLARRLERIWESLEHLPVLVHRKGPKTFAPISSAL
jgi:hypothetical protein